MATTATNKQPLLIDRPLHRAYTLTNQITGSDNTYQLSGNNFGVLVDCTQNDGALLEDIYAIPIAVPAQAIDIYLYLAPMSDVLRENEDTVVFVGGFTIKTDAAVGKRIHYNDMTLTLAPTPGAVPVAVAEKGPPEITQREAAQYQSFYVPAGYALWFGRKGTAAGGILVKGVDAPTIGASGGFY